MPKFPKYHKRNKRPTTKPITKAQQTSVPEESVVVNDHAVYEEPELPSWTKREDVIDYLSEDDALPNQTYACVSMLSMSKWRAERQREEAIELICNKEGYDKDLALKIINSWSEYEEPKRAFKIRGVYGEYKEARKRSEFLQRTHKNHNVAVMSAGFWVPFDPDPEKIGDQNYMEKELNELKEGYMMNREKGKEHFEEQKALKAQRARIEGSKWGQEQMLKRKETRKEVEHRLKTAEEDIAQFNDKIERAKGILDLAQKKISYMEEHPEIVLEEEDTPVDMENVPQEVLDGIKEQEKESDDRRIQLAEIESQRKTFNRNIQPQPSTNQQQQSAIDEQKVIMPHEARQEIKEHDEKGMKTI